MQIRQLSGLSRVHVGVGHPCLAAGGNEGLRGPWGPDGPWDSEERRMAYEENSRMCPLFLSGWVLPIVVWPGVSILFCLMSSAIDALMMRVSSFQLYPVAGIGANWRRPSQGEPVGQTSQRWPVIGRATVDGRLYRTRMRISATPVDEQSYGRCRLDDGRCSSDGGWWLFVDGQPVSNWQPSRRPSPHHLCLYPLPSILPHFCQLSLPRCWSQLGALRCPRFRSHQIHPILTSQTAQAAELRASAPLPYPPPLQLLPKTSLRDGATCHAVRSALPWARS